MTSRAKKPATPTTSIETARQAGRLGDQLCFALYAATNAMTRVYRPLLADLGLTYPQYLVLLVLWEQRSCRLGEIADQLNLATHAVSPIIDRLEEAGLAVRVDDEADRRAVKVELTPVGVALEACAADVQDEVRRRTQLDPDTVDRLRGDLHDLVQRLAVSDGHSGDSGRPRASSRSQSRSVRLTTLP